MKKIIGSSIASSACSGSSGSKNLKTWRKAMKLYRDSLLKELNILQGKKKKDIELINLLVGEIVKTNKIINKWK